MALRTGSGGRDVIGRLTRTTIEIACEGGRRRMAAAAVAARRVTRIVLDRPVIALSGHGGADQHPEELRALVTGLTGGDCRRHGGVTRDAEGRRIDARRTQLEASRVDVGDRVATRAVAVESPDRDVVPRTRDHGDVREWTDRRTVA